MVSTIRTIGHEDRLSLVDHLDELRTRLIIGRGACWPSPSASACGRTTRCCNHQRPAEGADAKQVAKGEGTVGQAVLAQQGVLKVGEDTQRRCGTLARPGSGLSSPHARPAAAAVVALKLDVAKVPRNPQGDNPATPGRRRAVHDDPHRVALFRPDRLAAGDPVRALRLHRPGAAVRPSGGSPRRC